MNEKSVLFVCLGNICRSTMAEGILKSIVSERQDKDDWLIDSCGTARYHIGDQPDDRTLKTLKMHDITSYKHQARQINQTDFKTYKWIFTMDTSNQADVKRIMPKTSPSNVRLLRTFDPEADCDNPIVIDAYYHDDSYFELCYVQCLRTLENFLKAEYSK